jgi:hypothetical protein
MVGCEMCGGLGRVGPGGITSRFGDLFAPTGGLGVRDCAWCHGTGWIADADPKPVPGQRTASPGPPLSDVLPGEWLVEIHGSGRILAVMRFLLTGKQSSHRFDARCEYGGLLGWEAKGEWMTLGPGDIIRFSGTQSSRYIPATGYYWGATLARLNGHVLHGKSLCEEWTMWSRQTDPALHGVTASALADGLEAVSP